MITPVMVWISVVGLFLLLLFSKIALGAVHHMHRRGLRHIVSLGSEREELYMPGDPVNEDDLPDDED